MRNHADANVTERGIEMFRCRTRRIECQQSALRIACLLFDSQHQGPGDAAAPSRRMDQQFPDLASMWLIRWRGKIELHRAEDLLSATSDDDAARSILHRRQHFVMPESRGFFAGKWKYETHRCSGVNAVIQQIAERTDILRELS